MVGTAVSSSKTTLMLDWPAIVVLAKMQCPLWALQNNIIETSLSCKPENNNRWAKGDNDSTLVTLSYNLKKDISPQISALFSDKI